MKALITGGAGFIGAHLAEHLCRKGATVDLIDNFSRGRQDDDLRKLLARPQVQCIEVDLRATDAFSGLAQDYDQIFHLAAIVGVANVQNRPFAVLRDNVELLLNVIDFAGQQNNLGRLVFASTSEVFAGSLEHLDLPLPTPESAPIALPDLGGPRSAYLLSKLYGEALCHHGGVPYTVLRPHNLYGPRMGLAHVIPELLQRASATPDGGELTIYSPRHTRAFCYVDDAVEMIARLAADPAAQGQVFNIGKQDEEVAIQDLAGRIVSLVGKNLQITPGPDTPGSPSRRCPDMARTIVTTDYRPQVSLDMGLRLTYDWYAQNVFEAPPDQAAFG